MTTQQIEQGKHILKMLECLAGYTEEEILRDHVKTLDEIDEAFLAFRFKMTTEELHHHLSENKMYNNLTLQTLKHGLIKNRTLNGYGVSVTRCRTALKSARPDGWMFSMHSYLPTGELKFIALNSTNSQNDIITPFLPTEEISELHAITQARIWDIENGGRND